MPVYFFSELSNGQAISFSPAEDHLTFDDAGIAAANVRLTASGANTRVEVVSGSQAGKHIILLNTAPTQLAGSSGGPTLSNTGFFDASSFALGDQNVGTTNDNNANLLVGTNQGDLLMGFGGADTLQGGNGNDTYVVGAGDVLSDSGGIDTVLSDVSWTLGAALENLTLTGSAAINGTGNALANRIEGNGGVNNIQAGDGNDTIAAGAGNDTISGNAGTDWVEGGLGNDQVSGGGGQDSFVLRATGASNADVLFDFATDWDNVQLDAAVFASIGASGRFAAGDERFHVGASAAEADDRIIFNSATRQIFYDADGSGTGAAQLIASLPSGRSVVAGDFWVFGTPPASGSHIVGTAGNDSLVGGPGNDTLEGLAGADTMQGQGGNDTYIVEGSDVLFDSAGTDTVLSESGWRLSNGDGIENVTTTSSEFFRAEAFGNELNNRLTGNDGVDVLGGRGGNDTMLGGGGNDEFVLSNPDGHDGHDVVDGGAGADEIYEVGSSAAVTVDFAAGTWTTGADGSASFSSIERISTGDFDDFIDARGVSYGVMVHAHNGDDTFFGGVGDDYFWGGEGADQANGGAGNDTIEGVGGDDQLSGGDGADRIFGGAGADRIRPDSQENPWDPTPEFDDYADAGAGDDVIWADGGDDTMLGGAGDDWFTMDSGSSDFAYYPRGNDSIDGGTGTDFILFSTEGISSTGAVVIDLGAGTYSIAEPTGTANGVVLNVENVQGSAGNDHIRGSNGANSLSGLYGTDTVEGLGGNDFLDMLGGNGLLTGGSGQDTLWGGMGSDTLSGGLGNDVLLGDQNFFNDDPDSYLFDVAAGAADADTILEFKAGIDEIVLDGNAYAAIGPTGNFAAGDGRFWAAAGASGGHDADDRVVYNTTTGQLWYDADGSGATAAQLIANVGNVPTLNASDIRVVNGSGGGGATEGDDLLIGTGGSDTIDGLGGNDTIHGLAGQDWLQGNDGNDSILGGAGDDFIEGDFVEGVHGDDFVDGGDGNDTLWGRRGDDTLNGGAGNDRFVMDSSSIGFDSNNIGSDLVDGGSGIDSIGFSTEGVSSTRAVDIDLTAGTYVVHEDTGDVQGTVLNVENAQGSTSGETIRGTDGANELNGLSGNDTLEGLAGDDLLIKFGGPGLLFGGAGNDSLDGGTGTDTLSGGLGNDRLNGDSDGPDFNADSFLFDVAPGAANADSIVSTAGNVSFESGSDKIVLDGNAHANSGPSGNFSAGDARFWAAAGANTGHDANDRVVYNNTTGQLWYDADGSGAGAAQLIATLQGAPSLAATDIEIVNGSGGGTPPILGTAGNDSMVGTAGNDTMNGLGGNDTMDGLAGDDRFLMTGTYGADRAYGRDGFDTVDFSGATGAVNASIVGSFASGGGGSVGMFTIERLVGSAFNDTLIGDANDNQLEGGAGNDTLIGREGRDYLIGGDGNDVFNMHNGGGSYGSDTLDGGGGIDTVEFGSIGRSAIAVDMVTGELVGGGPAGNGGTATLMFIENVTGTSYADHIRGDHGNNVLTGSNGNDTLIGNHGDDTLSGGVGADFFDFEAPPGSGVDRILDFASGTDTLRFISDAFPNSGTAGDWGAGDARFWASAGATSGHDSNDRLVYDTSTGSLYYDADGNGSGASVLVATFQGNPAIAAADISVI